MLGGFGHDGVGLIAKSGAFGGNDVMTGTLNENNEGEQKEEKRNGKVTSLHGGRG